MFKNHEELRKVLEAAGPKLGKNLRDLSKLAEQVEPGDPNRASMRIPVRVLWAVLRFSHTSVNDESGLDLLQRQVAHHLWKKGLKDVEVEVRWGLFIHVEGFVIRNRKASNPDQNDDLTWVERTINVA